MVVNFRIYKINHYTRKLAQTPTLNPHIVNINFNLFFSCIFLISSKYLIFLLGKRKTDVDNDVVIYFFICCRLKK